MRINFSDKGGASPPNPQSINQLKKEIMSKIIVCWPNSQMLSEFSGFFDNCELLNTPKQIAKYGSCAYRVDKDWYDMLKNGELEEMTEQEWEDNEGRN